MSSQKIFIFDIETAPIAAWVWGLFDQNVGLEMIASDWHVLSWSGKWHGAPAKEIMYYDQQNETDIENDKKILEELAKVLDEADVVVAHNGRKFDVKKINTRFLLHGIPIPSPYKVV